MRRSILAVVLLSTVAFSSSAFAGVGATSAGVTTTVGNTNEPSPDVQAQSSGFVQQNQQLQSGSTPNSAGSSAGTTVIATSAAIPGATGAAANTTNNADAAQAAQPNAAPAAPPAQAPSYESTMRRLDKHDAPGGATPPMTVEASGPAGAVRKPDAQPAVKPAGPAPAANSTRPAPAAAAGPRVSPPAVDIPPERITPPAITGGRGETPDGFTFYSGVTIAGALLAFALATFVRMGRNEGK
jgi:hypothetical protein